MSILIPLFTVVLVLDCLAMILLVLLQLPRKEAGLSQGFSDTAANALFGAGGGTVLTKLTNYAAAIFFILTILIAVLYRHQI